MNTAAVGLAFRILNRYHLDARLDHFIRCPLTAPSVRIVALPLCGSSNNLRGRE